MTTISSLQVPFRKHAGTKTELVTWNQQGLAFWCSSTSQEGTTLRVSTSPTHSSDRHQQVCVPWCDLVSSVQATRIATLVCTYLPETHVFDWPEEGEEDDLVIPVIIDRQPYNLFLDAPPVTDVTQLDAHLFQGSALSLDESTLKEYGITHVVNCAAEMHHRIYNQHQVTYCHVALVDTATTNLLQPSAFAACRFIAQAVDEGGRVLVHCAEGRSRSSAILLLYLVEMRQQSLADALAWLVARRTVACPHPAFVTQLDRWDKRIKQQQ
jgi:predicted protein tyrosine phosphatase